MKPFLLILSAPSGGGKTTIAQAILSARDDVGYSISATTRRPRAGEENGKDYYFLSEEEFERRRAAGDFLECARYGGNWYGTLAEDVERILGEGKHVVLDIEINGARQVRERRADVVSVFILPPSGEELMHRLGGRRSEDTAELKVRLERAVEELKSAPDYDYVVTNEDKTQAVAEVAAILDAETRKVVRQDDLETTLEELGTSIAAQIGKL